MENQFKSEMEDEMDTAVIFGLGRENQVLTR